MVSRDFRFLTAAFDLAHQGTAVFPLWARGKNPRIPNAHPEGDPLRGICHGECGRHGHGLYDATTDLSTIAHWWRCLYPGANIGAPVPAGQFVLDIDPQHGGHESLALLILDPDNGPLTATFTTISGRGTGGAHLFYKRPPGKLSAKRLGPGLDIKDALVGYTVRPPSMHPDSGKSYAYIDRPVVDPSDWLVELIVEPEPETRAYAPRSIFSSFWSDSIADEFGETTSWAEILEPHGWRCLNADPDADGAIWLHPNHSSACSATIRFGCLFVYSTNTPFEITELSNPNGYTKFRAYAVLYHNGDMSAAAQTLREAN